MMYIKEDMAMALLRVALGTVLVAHSALKFAVFGIPSTEMMFAAMGVWPWLALPVSAIEGVCGMALILGFWSGHAALLSLPILIGATWVHWNNGWVWTAKNGGWEYPLLLTVIAIIVAWAGPGRPAMNDQ